MSALLDIVLGAVAEPVMHTLLHFLWQGCLVALGLAGVLLVLRPRRAEVRYRWACGALLLMVVLPMLTGARFKGEEAVQYGIGHILAEDAADITLINQTDCLVISSTNTTDCTIQ